MTSGPDKDLALLIQRARQGDRDARNELFEHCRAYVRFLARSHVESWIQSKVDSSDLVQQTLLEAHQAFDDFAGQTEGEWLAWLKRILRNNATDFVRRFGAARRRAALEVALNSGGQSSMFRRVPEPAADDRSPSAIVSQQEQDLLLSRALDTLTGDYQEVIVLRHLERLPFDEVAARMNRSRPAVQMLWMRALRKLQAHLQHIADQSAG